MTTVGRKQTLYMGCDGFGEDLKNGLKSHLQDKGGSDAFEIHDLGTDTYFDIAGKVAAEILAATKVKEENEAPPPMGILVCGTGMGVGMVANKFPGIRAATVENVVATRYARAVNNANVLCLGQLVTPLPQAKDMLDAFLQQTFCTAPTLEDGTTPAPWWSEQVETFLSTSHEGIARVEELAKTVPSQSRLSST